LKKYLAKHLIQRSKYMACFELPLIHTCPTDRFCFQ